MSVDYSGKGKATGVLKPSVPGEGLPLTVGSDMPMADAVMAVRGNVDIVHPSPLFIALLAAIVQKEGIAGYAATVADHTLKSRIDRIKAAEEKILLMWRQG